MSVSIPSGIDFGNGVATLGVARNRGIDIVVNEVSNRTTPSLVAFGLKNRFSGEAAKSQQTSNIKNTVGSLKRLIGRKDVDPAIEVERQYNAARLEGLDGDAAARVQYLGNTRSFNFTQLTAMYFNKLRSTLLNESKGNIYDVVITVPPYFVDAQRRAVADAAVIAGFNPVRIVNDVTAAAVGWGVFKTDFPEDKYVNVAIVDIGESDTTVSIVAFKKGEAKVRGTATEKNFGGRNIDMLIAQHFANIFKDKYKIDVTTNPKAFSRMLGQAERLKKILSANTTAMFNIESLMNDVDVSASMQREELESYLEPYLTSLERPIALALADAKLTPDDLASVELIGGCTRVPAVKQRVSDAFGGKPLSFTMNQDEAVVRGATFICAMHSPTVRVRPFRFEDTNNHSVTFRWERTEDEDIDHLEVFPKGSLFPSTKVVTLFRKEDFKLEALYTDPETLDEGVSPQIGTWHVKGVKPAANGDAVAVKIKLRQDVNGLYVVESAYTAEEVTVEEPIEEPKPEEGDEDAEPTEPKTRTVKKWVKKDDLEIVHQFTGLDEAKLNYYTEEEAKMAAEDKLVADTEERKNALEEYIYEIRDKLDGSLAEFASPEEKKRLLEMADKAEEWLYGDGESGTKAQYIARYEELASIGNLIKGRHQSKLEEERQAKLAEKEAEQNRKMAEKMQAEKAAREAEAESEQKDAEMNETE